MIKTHGFVAENLKDDDEEADDEDVEEEEDGFRILIH